MKRLWNLELARKIASLSLQLSVMTRARRFWRC
jgi:hypothetical protein